LTVSRPWPTFWAVRLARIAALSVLLFAAFCIAETTPYLGLPFEPRPAFLDCYEQARWDGRVFVETGRTICLADQEVPEVLVDSAGPGRQDSLQPLEE